MIVRRFEKKEEVYGWCQPVEEALEACGHTAYALLMAATSLFYHQRLEPDSEAATICNRTRIAIIRLQWTRGTQNIYMYSFLPDQGLATCISALDYCISNPVFVIPYLDKTVEEKPSIKFVAGLKAIRKYLSLVRDEQFEPSLSLYQNEYDLEHYEIDLLETDAIGEASKAFTLDPPRISDGRSMGCDAGKKAGALDLLRTLAIDDTIKKFGPPTFCNFSSVHFWELKQIRWEWRDGSSMVCRDLGTTTIPPDDKWFREIVWSRWIFDGFKFLETVGQFAMPKNCYDRHKYATVACVDVPNASLLFLAHYNLGGEEYFRYSLEHASGEILTEAISDDEFRQAEAKAEGKG